MKNIPENFRDAAVVCKCGIKFPQLLKKMPSAANNKFVTKNNNIKKVSENSFRVRTLEDINIVDFIS